MTHGIPNLGHDLYPLDRFTMKKSPDSAQNVLKTGNKPAAQKTIASVRTEHDDVWVVGDKYFEAAKFPDLPGVEALEGHLAGGAWFVTRFLKLAFKCRGGSTPTISTYEELESTPPIETIATTHAYKQYQSFPEEHDKPNPRVLRLDETGYVEPEVMKFNVFNENYGPKRLLIIEDMDLGYRVKGKQEWKQILDNIKSPRASALSSLTPRIIVLLGGELHKESDEPRAGLWNKLATKHARHSVIIVNADLLRSMGADISRRVSWERTAQDLVRELQCHPRLKQLKMFSHIVVRFGVTAAIYAYKDRNGSHQILYYDSKSHDGIFRDILNEGGVIGSNSIFTACIATELLDKNNKLSPSEKIRIAITKAIPACQRLFRRGYPSVTEHTIGDWLKAWPDQHVFNSAPYDEKIKFQVGDPTFQEFVRGVEIPPAAENWSIIKQATADVSSINLAKRIVCQGVDKTLNLPLNITIREPEFLQCHAPIARFGRITILDRDEIESFRGIYNLMKHYVSSPKDDRPLCLAVFGPPGSGKTFAVEQIAEEVRSKRVPIVQVNMAQITSIDDLTVFLAANLDQARLID